MPCLQQDGDMGRSDILSSTVIVHDTQLKEPICRGSEPDARHSKGSFSSR